MKIIFLDVDGVLNHSQCPEWVNGNPHVLAPECVEQLQRIMIWTGARIVLSSTWRLSDEETNIIAKAVNLFDEVPDVVGKTPILNWTAERKEEILKWLADVWPLSFGWNEEVITHMVVLDVDTDADLGDGSFFKTSFEGGGLTQEIADRVITHLGGK